MIPVHHDTSSAWGAHLWEPAVGGRGAPQDSPLGDIFFWLQWSCQDQLWSDAKPARQPRLISWRQKSVQAYMM